MNAGSLTTTKKKHLASARSITQLASSQVTGYKKGMQKRYRLFPEDIIPMCVYPGPKRPIKFQAHNQYDCFFFFFKYRYFIQLLNKSMRNPTRIIGIVLILLPWKDIMNWTRHLRKQREKIKQKK